MLINVQKLLGPTTNNQLVSPAVTHNIHPSTLSPLGYFFSPKVSFKQYLIPGKLLAEFSP
jgi:hypothetical protein